MRIAIPDLQHAMQGQCGACIHACLPLSQHKTAGLCAQIVLAQLEDAGN